MRYKVTVVGAGNVGATCAQLIAQADLADVVMVDVAAEEARETLGLALVALWMGVIVINARRRR